MEMEEVEKRKMKTKALIIGNLIDSNGCTSTLIYDYENDSITKGPEMIIARGDHCSVTLPNDNIVVFGGYNKNIDGRYLSSCEVFDSKKVTFTEIGKMIERREKSAAVLLNNGIVFIIGGLDCYSYSKSCEYFNPYGNVFFQSPAKLKVGRTGHTASLLGNGEVIVCGGYSEGNALRTTEIFNPITETFYDGPSMIGLRFMHTATTLLDGRILFVGSGNTTSLKSTEFYDPKTNSFYIGPQLNVPRYGHFAILLPDGKVLIGGGHSLESRKTSEIFNPINNSFEKSSIVFEEKYCATAALF